MSETITEYTDLIIDQEENTKMYTNDETTMKYRAELYKKVNIMRDLITKADFKKDKMHSQGWEYLSLDKTKAAIAPLFAKAGLDYKERYANEHELTPVGNFKTRWTIEFHVSLVDTTTGFIDDEERYIGEAGDSGDAGLRKAQSFAYKNWLNSKFMVSDGMDAEDSDFPIKRGYTPISESETSELTAKLRAGSAVSTKKAAAAPSNGEEKPSKTVKTAEKAKVPVAKPAEEAPKAAEKPAEAPAEPAKEAEKPAEAPAEGEIPEPKAVGSFTLLSMQTKMLKNLCVKWDAAVKAGTETQENYDAFLNEYQNLADAKAVMALSKKKPKTE